MSLHYGIWFENTSSLSEALKNTNSTLSDLVNIKPGDVVLDAGCGVGGSCIFLANKKDAYVKGITLSDRQVVTANQNVAMLNLESRIEIFKMDYTNTTFDDNSFDVVWACESLSSLDNKTLFVKEAFRILKPNGKLIIADLFRSSDEPSYLLEKLSKSWAMARLSTLEDLEDILRKSGFDVSTKRDYSKEIYKTSKRIYRASLLGKFPSLVYNLLFGASEYARNHYKSGIYQFKALQQGLWKYQVLLALKK